MIKTTVSSLFDIMRPCFNNFPDDYLCIDVETTGLNFHRGGTTFFPESDLITQLGYCLVKDRKAVSQGAFVLNWLLVPGIDRQALIDRLAFTKDKVEFKNGAPTGKKYHTTIEKLETEGTEPIAVLKAFKTDLLDVTRANRMFFVAHNGYSFDARMIYSHTNFWLKDPFEFGDSEMLDTGAIEKASQINCLPWWGDTARDWSFRTYRGRIKGIKWSLDKACVKRYGLDERHYLPIDINGKLDEAHDAGFDSYLCHLLFEEYKDILSGRKQEPPVPYEHTHG